MKCRWCSGTGKHRGRAAETELCEHCLGFGETADPPGTALRHVLSEAACVQAADWFVHRPAAANASSEAFGQWLVSFVQEVAQSVSKQPLPAVAADELAAYWRCATRDETLGEFIQRIAQCAVDHAKT